MEMTSKMPILITYAKSYEMEDENLKGCTVHYFFYGEDGSGITPIHSVKNDEAVGYQRGKVSLPYEMRSKIPWAPAIYMGEFIMTVGSDGKPVMKLVDVEFVQTFDFKSMTAAEGTKK